MFGQDHTRLKSHSCTKPRLVFVRFTTNGSNVVQNFTNSGNPNNPLAVGGIIGTPAIFQIGRFRAMRAAIRFSGPVTATPTASGEIGEITIATAANNTYEFMFLLDSY